MHSFLLRLIVAVHLFLPATSPTTYTNPTNDPTVDPTARPAVDDTIEPQAEALATFVPAAFLPLIQGVSTTGDPIEQRVIDLTNELRAQAGCPPLQHSANLATAARSHSRDMATNDFFDHIGSDGSTPSQRIHSAGYRPTISAENIGAGFGTAESVMTAWTNSSGHRRNLLNCALTDIGVGYVYVASSEYGHYWTQEFGRP
jgi:uncharacterized protein YkwD